MVGLTIEYGEEKLSAGSMQKRRSFFFAVGMSLVFLFVLQGLAHAAGFAATGNMGTARQMHTATLINYSSVLVTGGTNGDNTSTFNTAEIYRSATGVFTPTTGTMSTARKVHTATKLSDGVLITGGYTGTAVTATAETYSPGTGSFTPTGDMNTPRQLHTATLLQNGKVLVTGGRSDTSPSSTLATCELYDPTTRSFRTVGSMTKKRAYHTATLLNDGRVLITGGIVYDATASPTNTAEIYDPATESFTPVTATMTSPRNYHTANLFHLVNDGGTKEWFVLISGGANGSAGASLQSAEVFDPASGTFTATGSMYAPHSKHTATYLPASGHVLIAGDTSYESNTGDFFLGDFGNISISAGTMVTGRASHTAVLLDNGKVLLAGGRTNGATSAATSSAELYDPAAIASTPPSYAFPDTLINTSSSQTFTIRNNGGSQIVLSSITFSGTNSSLFSKSGGTCSNTTILAGNGGNCTVIVKFAPGAVTGMKSASLNIASDDPERPTLLVPLSGKAVMQQFTLTVMFGGDGAGSTSSATEGLTCLSSASPSECKAVVDTGTQITVIPTANGNSRFNGWTSNPVTAGCSDAGDCVVTMSADISATARFDYVKPATIAGTSLYFDTLQKAYDSAVSGSGTTVLARAFTFMESPVFNGSTPITLSGGCDLTYSPGSDYSVVNGKVTVGTGAVVVSNIIIR